MSATVIEVFRSQSRFPCEERALVLAAVGIASAIEHDGVQFILQVDAPEAPRALSQLNQYETENRSTPAAAPLPRLYGNAWLSCVIFCAVLMLIALLSSSGAWRPDAFEVGELDAGRVQDGQWWRAWTALTLHLDAAHLAGNLGAGSWFGYLAARQVGPGSAWFLIVSGAALANLLEAQLGPPTHRAVGASTAVFTALGLLSAHSWRTRWHLPQRRALRWAPLVAGAVLLALTGTAGEGTDLVAHALGFLIGALLGVAAALPLAQRALTGVPQWLAGLAALTSIAIAWACALAS